MLSSLEELLAEFFPRREEEEDGCSVAPAAAAAAAAARRRRRRHDRESGLTAISSFPPAPRTLPQRLQSACEAPRGSGAPEERESCGGKKGVGELEVEKKEVEVSS